MKNTLSRILLLFIMSGVIVSCTKDDEDIYKPILGLGGETWKHGEIDTWIYENFTKPWNIAVKYRWDGSELALDKTLVPVKEEKVIPLMETVKQAWIDVYVAEAGEVFVKNLAPKQYVLVGSPQYNTSGTITLGEAEGGRKVTLFRVNDFDKTNRNIVKPILKTIHHEFAHILHQNIMYPPEYAQITPTGYTSSWNNIATATARADGYITPYAQSSPNEDFVEMIAIMLTEGRAGYEAIIAGIDNPVAVANLRKKEEIVITYYKQVWNIDFHSLQARTEAAIEEIAPAPVIPLHTMLGAGKTYSSIFMNVNDLPDLSDDFLDKYNTANEGLGSIGGAGRYFEHIKLIYGENNQMTFQIQYRNPNVPASFYLANFVYNVSVDNNGVADFTLAEAPAGNANTIKNYVVALTDYIENNNFKIAWKDGKPVVGAAEQHGKFTVADNPASFFYGVLGN